MGNLERAGSAMEYFRGNELSPGVVDTTNRVEPPTAPQTNPEFRARGKGIEGLSPEREKQLETFMEQIKTFIRGIDVNSL